MVYQPHKVLSNELEHLGELRELVAGHVPPIVYSDAVNLFDCAKRARELENILFTLVNEFSELLSVEWCPCCAANWGKGEQCSDTCEWRKAQALADILRDHSVELRHHPLMLGVEQ
jgi:hypothetical protein